MGDLIIYENDMNKLKFGNFTKVSMNFFMALCYFMKNKGTTQFSISFDELKEKAHYTQTEKKDFINDLNFMTDQMLEVNSMIIENTPSGKKRIYKFDLFPTFVIDEETETLEVAVNERFAWLFNEFDHYTSIDLEEIVGFKSKYTKNLFRLIRQWKSKGELRITGDSNIQDFREKIGVKDTYSNAEMNRRCIAPAINEINESNCSIKNLSYQLEYADRRGKPLKSIIFTWNKVMAENTKQISDNNSESAYDATREALKDYPEFKDADIKSIGKAALKNGISDEQIKQRIKYALKKDNIKDPVAYIVALMQDFNDVVDIKNKLNKFNNFQQRSYDYDELERILVGDHTPKTAPTQSEEPTTKMSNNVNTKEEDHNMKDTKEYTATDYIVTDKEGNEYLVETKDPNYEKEAHEKLKALLEIAKNTLDKNCE